MADLNDVKNVLSEVSGKGVDIAKNVGSAIKDKVTTVIAENTTNEEKGMANFSHDLKNAFLKTDEKELGIDSKSLKGMSLDEKKDFITKRRAEKAAEIAPKTGSDDGVSKDDQIEADEQQPDV